MKTLYVIENKSSSRAGSILVDFESKKIITFSILSPTEATEALSDEAYIKKFSKMFNTEVEIISFEKQKLLTEKEINEIVWDMK